MRWVRMRHDGVEHEITVAESAVSIHLAAGWTEVPDPEPQGGAGSGSGVKAPKKMAAPEAESGE